MRLFFHIGYYLSAGATGMLLALALCMVNPGSAFADDPGPSGPDCENKGPVRRCEIDCSQDPGATCPNGKCDKTKVNCSKCVCRIYNWGPPQNAPNCECQIPVSPED